jgi:hypothetical protein
MAISPDPSDEQRVDLAELLRRVLSPQTDPATWRERYERGYRRFVEKVLEVGHAISAAFDEGLPPNWRNLTIPDIFRARDLMRTEGISVAWTPTGQLLRAVLDAPDPDARLALMVDSEAEILADLDELVASGNPPEERRFLWQAAREALEAYRAGFFLPSQALAAAILSTGLHELTGETRFVEVRKSLPEVDPEKEGPEVLRASAVIGAADRTLDHYTPADDMPGFRRHGTAHWVIPRQYTQAHALSAVMLMVSFLIEIEWLAERGNDET